MKSHSPLTRIIVVLPRDFRELVGRLHDGHSPLTRIIVVLPKAQSPFPWPVGRHSPLTRIIVVLPRGRLDRSDFGQQVTVP